MNTDLINVTEEELDLLAEGELSSEARAALFQRLDEHPRQWRTCALSVLETQAVGAGLRSNLDEQTQQVLCGRAAKSSRNSRYFAVLPWAVVASLLLVASVGVAVGMVVGHQFGEKPIARHKTVRDVESLDKPNSENQDVEAIRLGARRVLDRLNIGDERVLAVVQVENNGEESFVPVIASHMLAYHLLRDPIPPISPRQIQLANRNGWNITQQKHLLAIERPSAKTEIVPLRLMKYQLVGKELL